MLAPDPVVAGCHDPAGERSVVRRLEETTKPRTGLASDVVHREKSTVVKADIQCEDLG
jgi:hypothetical protein